MGGISEGEEEMLFIFGLCEYEILLCQLVLLAKRVLEFLKSQKFRKKNV